MKLLHVALIAGSVLATSLPAAAFEINFTWDGLKSCTNGRPNTVQNPAFALKDVPEGTKFIEFRLKDLDAASYNHGGGKVAYTGQSEIASGAFKYKSPCPPNGVHKYQWTATARSKKSGGKIATTKRMRPYPE
jgi:phosphatidylethanolamine-binding protein (PEBP) family uncharacterized protein